ncbi:MAG: putative magnesium or manganese-dependent protein phosphatase [Frankiales bacterium]|nr:putative magnesium or manganese-dependent protein phosphatase [Frankiales bacterium]
MTTAAGVRPPDEEDRLAAVRRYEVLDTPPDGAFDRITALAARAFGVPIAIVSIVDSDRIWFKSRHGLPDDLVEIDRAPGLCASAILGSEPWIVADAPHDPRTLANPLVAGDFGLRFYAGVPLTTRDGYNLGTLCVLDTAPRAVTADETLMLQDLAALVIDQMELRLESREVLRLEAQLRRDAERLADVLQASLLPPTPPTVPGMDVASVFVAAADQGLRIGGDFLDVFRLSGNDWALVLGDVCGKGARAAALTGLARWTLRAVAVHAFAPSEVLRELNATLLADGDADDHFCTAVFGRLELDVCGAWVTLATSGHPQPILVRGTGLVERRGVPSLPLGMFEDIDPVDDRVGLGPSDCLVFYTDGIIEARDAAGGLFGTSRLVEVLREASGCEAEEIVRRVISAARKHSAAGLTDDAAVLVVRVPEQARGAGIGRVVEATGMLTSELALPDYAHGGSAPTGSNEDEI